MLKVIPIPAFKDNYIWLLLNTENNNCAVVDPGEADPVLNYIKKNNLHLKDILITHHHQDHTGGINKLIDEIPGLAVYGPTNDKVAHLDHPLSEKTPVHLASINADFQILDIPAHTNGHIAYFGEGMLFCGDTLFSAGCGRVFEGTFEQMYHALQKISRLPASTAIYCGHEYTQANLKFAETVEPHNADIQNKINEVASLREKGEPTLPSTVELEKKINPFLRCDKPDVVMAAQTKSGEKNNDPLFVFQTLRTWKDSF